MKNRPNKNCLETDMGVIIAEALRIAKVNNCNVHQEFDHYCLHRGKSDVHVTLGTDTSVKIDLSSLHLDGRIGKDYWELMKTIEDDTFKILLAEPGSVEKLARIFRAIKPCWW